MKYCSLGENCTSTHILKMLKLKSESFPFDWLFSDTNIVETSLKDNFKLFLDKNEYESIKKKEEYDWMLPHERVARHKTFNKDTPIKKPMFRHRDPATFEEDYAYFERCIERFRTLISSNAKKVFVKTYINRTPEDEKEALDDAIGLVKTLDKYTNNFKLVAIHISPVGKRQYGLKFSHNLIFCNLKTITESTGIDHTDEEDNVYLRQTFLNILKMI